jgi:hypothetical protein
MQPILEIIFVDKSHEMKCLSHVRISISRFEVPTPLAYTEQMRLLYPDTHPTPVYLMPPDFHYFHHFTKPRTAEKK